jgi:predicted nucleic acid-binding protein
MTGSSTEVPLHYVLDTSAYIDLEAVDLGPFDDGIPVLTAISIGELAFGLQLGDPEQQEQRERLFREALADFEILGYGVEQAQLYGVLATLVRAAGRKPRPRRLDLQIAATAAAAGLPLLTCNPADFVGADRLVKVVAASRSPGGPDPGR